MTFTNTGSDPTVAGSIGLLGWLTSWSLTDIHLIAASSAASFTCIYMVVAIYKKLKE